ncbi:cytochrome c [Paraburkholderia sp. Ac-20336]|uniref:c-type cytochrome n=1 Tax=unclassified Paraburkholderia TaxID=2615204 RepID=UPI00141F1711|nr:MULTISPECIES: cytochrome c [unclassified Paraburkholderia]MBN3801880.1 cytochrome c [Paraburkholderia sp. Ac-20336]MBN3846232.1 cytochrome c [Paraburkholderia sp. Ac-20342]NIF81350.1 cytochrome c [Paraburkholderia sp. Cy-641]
MRKITFAIASAVVFSAASAGVFAQSSATASPSASADTDAQLIQKGRYLAAAGDCIACHTAKGGKPFAGGLGIASPIGTIYSTNITPDKSTGIGNYTFDDFDRAVRHGIAKDGSTLYPAMPYVSYAKVKPSDVKALYAYFMHGVEPVSQGNRASDIPWPLSMRWPLRFWRMAFAPEAVSDDSPLPNDPIARGRYLVEGLAHCSACHTPRGYGLEEKSLTDDGKLFLSGGVVDGYLAKNLRGDRKDGLGNWSAADIVAFLKSGRTAHSAAFGGMADVVQDSTQHLGDQDLAAIAAYLKTLAPVDASGSTLSPDATAANALRAGTDHSNGALTFVDNCAACHRTSGSGYESTFPTLALSTVVNTDDPTSLIHIVLQGGEMPWTKAGPTHYAMPGFATRLTDRDVADVLTFVRSSWGNHASPVTSEQVAKVRKSSGSASQPARAENP